MVTVDRLDGRLNLQDLPQYTYSTHTSSYSNPYPPPTTVIGLVSTAVCILKRREVPAGRQIMNALHLSWRARVTERDRQKVRERLYSTVSLLCGIMEPPPPHHCKPCTLSPLFLLYLCFSSPSLYLLPPYFLLIHAHSHTYRTEPTDC